MLPKMNDAVLRSNPCFNGHPPLGVNATAAPADFSASLYSGFNGHPPLGVNATLWQLFVRRLNLEACFNGHPPLGVNATVALLLCGEQLHRVSMGTHPWG